MSGNTKSITDASFKQEIEDYKGTVLVDFWAEWCGPCRMIAPHVEQIAEELTGKLKVCKVDIDENQESAGKYNVRSIPCLILFKDGQVLDTVVGARPKGDLRAWIDKHVGAGQ